MKIVSISVSNYRLLDSVENLRIEDDVTVIVGKNNTGKTSLFEVINIFTSGKGNSGFSFEDFSQSTYRKFKKLACAVEYINTHELSEERKEYLEKLIIANTPQIELKIEFEYDKEKDKLTSLSDFITDLDETRTDATVLMTYEPINSLGLFSAYYKKREEGIIKFLIDNIKTYYTSRYYALDKNSSYKRIIESGFKEKLNRIAVFEEIRALRILDDSKEDKNRSLALSFSKYYNDKEKKDKDIEKLEGTLEEISKLLKVSYNETLQTPLEKIKDFGATTPLVIPDITIESEFIPEDVIRHNIKYYYTKKDVNLPESYNGLGYSNLIYLVLEVMTFVKRFKSTLVIDPETKKQNARNLVIMIEEPESHMHPQMQQIFVRGIKKMLKEEKDRGLDIQLIITSHSSYVVAEMGIDEQKGFEQLRYFGSSGNKHFIKDFNKFKLKNDKETFRFLKQYLTLHKCDLFFADKAIMVEGLTERVLLPQMKAKCAKSLLYEYVTVLEIGGAYGHKFKELIEFIEIKTLIITDLDSVDDKGVGCPVNKGITTSNETLKQWIPQKESIEELKSCSEGDKISGGLIRVTYQIAEENEEYIARSFEEAFIQRNKALITSKYVMDGKERNTKDKFSFFNKKKIEDIISADSFALAPSDKAKSNFAFDIMCFDEETCGKWEVPRYISEGLVWLAENNDNK